MDWTKTLLDVINIKSFSSLWYWIMLAVAWSSVSHYVMGVPFDMIARARRYGGEAYTDFEDMVRINVNRALYITSVSGMWLLGFVTFFLTSLLMLGFWYRLEFAQAVSFILVPMTLVGVLTIRCAIWIYRNEPQGEALFRKLSRHRLWTQVIGMVSIFFTTMYGMYWNFSILPHFY